VGHSADAMDFNLWQLSLKENNLRPTFVENLWPFPSNVAMPLQCSKVWETCKIYEQEDLQVV